MKTKPKLENKAVEVKEGASFPWLHATQLAKNALVAILVIILFDHVRAICALAEAAPAPPQNRTQSRPAEDQSSSTHSKPPVGQKAFASTCAACHGLDGQGSDKAPNIAGSEKVQRYSDARISSIISNGIPGTAMPAFHTLSPTRVREIISYLRTLQGRQEARSTPGDAKRGKEIFFGKGECSSCHTIFGSGGFLGPDLSAYGSANAGQILDALLSAERVMSAGYRPVVVTTNDRKQIEGIIRDEDNFSLQLQTKDGSFYFFQKSDLKNIDRPAQSIMPTNYRDRLTTVELNDLIKYMINGGRSQRQARISPDNDREEDFE